MNIKLFVNDFVDRVWNLYSAEGISKILKHEYGTHLGAGYVFYLLSAMKTKTVMPDKEAEDSILVRKCIEDFGD